MDSLIEAAEEVLVWGHGKWDNVVDKSLLGKLIAFCLEN
jgi:hypothetical protein